MNLYRCWSPEFEEGKDEGQTVEAYSAEDAAEEHAEYLYNNGDPFRTVEVTVHDEDGAVTEWIVAVEYEPSFGATQRKAPK